MKKLRIFANLDMQPDVSHLLHAGTSGHELIFPKFHVASTSAQRSDESELATVDIAFGQPSPQAITKASRLKWIHISSSGITRYDNLEFRKMMAIRNIAVSNSASVYNEPCAAHALSFMLSQARNLHRALRTRALGGTSIWNSLRNSSTTLRGETLVIVGYGAIGMRLAQLVKPFGMTIIACRRKPHGDEGITTVALDKLNRVLLGADHVMNILPESEETRHFFDRTRLKEIKQGAIFYNIGRGATVDQDALLEALNIGHLGAAWLDVTDPEPLPDHHPLWTTPNCFITPHTAGGHVDETKSLVLHFLNNLDHFVHGRKIQDRVI